MATNSRIHSSSYKKRLLNVVGILILAALLYFGYSWVGLKSSDPTSPEKRDTQRQSDLRMVQSGILAYYEKNGRYPDFLYSLTPDYLSMIPADPKTKAQYIYTYDSRVYRVCAEFELRGQVCEPSPEAAMSGLIPQLSQVEYSNKSIGFKFLYPADFSLRKIAGGVPYSMARDVLDPSSSDRIGLTAEDISGVISVNIGGIGMEDENESELSTQNIKVSDTSVTLSVLGNKSNLDDDQRAHAFFSYKGNDYGINFFWKGENKKNVATIIDILSSFSFTNRTTEKK